MTGRLLIISLLAPMWISASAVTYFSANPRNGKLPANLHTENTGNASPSESVYKNGFTTDGWTVEAVDALSYAFVAPSHSGKGLAMDSRLTTDPFTVDSAEAWLRWSAKSMLPGFPETYCVTVTDISDGSSKIVAEISGEDSKWQTRLVPLTEFAGKEVTVSLICRSVDKYMLAVSEIYAGAFEESEWRIDNKSKRYAAFNEGATATGTVRNIGKPAEGVSIVCRSGDLELTQEISGVWGTDDILDYNFNLPVTLNCTTPYIIGVKDKEGNFTELTSSEVFTSHFVRNLVVDEGTGMWCNNCPNGILLLDNLKEEYGDNIIILSCHGGNDVLTLNDYWSNLKFYAVPYLMLNRNHDSARSDTKNFDKEYNSPTVAEITLPGSIVSGTGCVEVTANTRFAESIDNSDGRYKIGYTVIADIYRPDLLYYQENNLTYPRAAQYYFLPSFIPPTLARFDNVVLSEECAFSGLEGSIPVEVVPMTLYGHSFSIQLPENAFEAENVRVAAYILDTATGLILNAASSLIELSASTPAVQDYPSGNRLSIIMTQGNRCIVNGIDGKQTVTVTVTDPSGRIFDNVTVSADALTEIPLKMPSGLAIISATTSDARATTLKHSLH